MTNRSLPVALAAATLLAVPGSALAASPATVTAGPITVKGYELFLVASDGGAQDHVSLSLTRTAGKHTQTHSYSFDRGVSVKVSGSKGSASIKGGMGRFGRLDLALKAGKAAKGTVPKGCTGKAGSSRRGTFKGTFRFSPDTTFFRTINRKQLKGALVTGGSLKCTGTPGDGGGGTGSTSGTTLTSTQQTDAGTLTLAFSRTGSAVTQSVMRMDDEAKIAPASSVMHSISASAPASGLEPSSDGTSATALGAGPFLSGRLSFSGESVGGGFSMGTLTGDLVAKFDSIGSQSVAASSPDAQLISR